jgi:hypothetical protein
MNLSTAMQGGERITKQRNLFLALTILLSISTCALDIKTLIQEERIIVVPPLTSEVWFAQYWNISCCSKCCFEAD